MGTMVVRSMGVIACPICGEIQCNLMRFETGFGSIYLPRSTPVFYISRQYSCSSCDMVIELTTKEVGDHPRLEVILRKDNEWAENLKSGKNS